MINAKEARDMTAGSKQMVEDHLQKIDPKIREAAVKGKTKIEYSFPLEELVEPLIKAVKEHGYFAQQAHANGIEISSSATPDIF